MSLSDLAGRWPRFDWRARPALSVETLVLLASLFFALLCNGAFFGAALAGQPLAEARTWIFAVAVFVLLAAWHGALLLLVCNRVTVRPLLALLLLATAFAVYFIQRFNVFLDPSMLRNVLRTDAKEAGELFTWRLLGFVLLYAGLPLLLLARVRVAARPLAGSFLRRLFWVIAALALGLGALLLVFQDFASLMRNQPALRYRITPANYVYSLLRVASADARAVAGPRLVVGADAKLAPAWAARQRPVVFVVVVGETARAANWGLSGYARQTTPELARLPVINFSQVRSCGTNTEVSLPCMFAATGRRDYDEQRIRRSETLLHVLQRAGLSVLWRDNQSGCKGICDGVPSERLSTAKLPGLCDGDRCLDEILLHDLDRIVDGAKGPLVLVLHQLGNHGPAYFRRYPPAFARFTPACESTDLRSCRSEQIVNAYDNALLYTDHVLARLIGWLGERQGKLDSALIYVSDHGESLGENNLYLHGLPYAIAPRVQTEVPMLMWFSDGYTKDFGLDLDCLRRRASQPASHDHLFHSVLGLLDVKTSAYAREYDLAADCRR